MHFHVLYVALALATVLIEVRSIFRVAELSGGFKGRLWNDETLFLVLDGAMVAAAALLMTIFHPARAFGDAPVWRRAADKAADDVVA